MNKEFTLEKNENKTKQNPPKRWKKKKKAQGSHYRQFRLVQNVRGTRKDIFCVYGESRTHRSPDVFGPIENDLQFYQMTGRFTTATPKPQ